MVGQEGDPVHCLESIWDKNQISNTLNDRYERGTVRAFILTHSYSYRQQLDMDNTGSDIYQYSVLSEFSKTMLVIDLYSVLVFQVLHIYQSHLQHTCCIINPKLGCGGWERSFCICATDKKSSVALQVCNSDSVLTTTIEVLLTV